MLWLFLSKRYKEGYLYFFSSRRWHSRYIGDWSSDVCSSDLFGMYRCFGFGGADLRDAAAGDFDRSDRGKADLILFEGASEIGDRARSGCRGRRIGISTEIDRKSTRLNSSHRCISYAVFCLKK